jgi:hypothetical protein
MSPPRKDDSPGTSTPRGQNEIAATTKQRAPAVVAMVTHDAEVAGELAAWQVTT